MELKRDYFPTMKAPDIAKKKVMQYIYGNKKNLTKRFYFYRIYAPAFLLLFIIWGGAVFYNKELKPNKDIYSVVSDYGKAEIGIQNQNIDNPIEENKSTPQSYSSIQVPTQEVSVVDSVSQRQIGGTDGGTPTTDTLSNNTPNNVNDSNVMMTKSLMISESSPIIAKDEPSLNQQISELESLMNDISSITSQEEILF